MYVPAARERVHIQGRSQHYFVLAVDREEELAYLADLSGPGFVLEEKFVELSACACEVEGDAGEREISAEATSI